MMRAILNLAAFAAALVLTGPTQAQPAPLGELAPKGPVRVAIAISPAPSALYAIKDASGQFKGVTVDLGNAIAAKAGRPVQFVAYASTGEITAAGDTDAWDVTFMPHDPARAKLVDFGAAYHLLQSTLLVAGHANVKTLADVDRPDIRVAGVEGTATARAAAAFLKQAKVVHVRGVDDAVALVNAGNAEAIGLSRESLVGLLGKVPGSRVLDGGFLNTMTAVAVPRGRAAALVYASTVIEEQKANGGVRKSLDAMGLTSSVVAPAGAKP
ncbi:transporter substrate-binding domain-containing protein [Ferrovibrio terrae]|uniref:transporter substrate-binding domain-containing protein n=1 Tax=Ferrovibrio terrae TaxID=2594003 RepID=UPI0031377122